MWTNFCPIIVASICISDDIIVISDTKTLDCKKLWHCCNPRPLSYLLPYSSKTPSELINDGYHQTNAATPQTSETGMLGLTSINGRTDLRTFDAQRPECFQNEVTRL